MIVPQKQIEKELFLRLRHRFSLNVDLVFYDLTSTYLEGNGPAGVARHGLVGMRSRTTAKSGWGW